MADEKLTDDPKVQALPAAQADGSAEKIADHTAALVEPAQPKVDSGPNSAVEGTVRLGPPFPSQVRWGDLPSSRFGIESANPSSAIVLALQQPVVTSGLAIVKIAFTRYAPEVMLVADGVVPEYLAGRPVLTVQDALQGLPPGKRAVITWPVYRQWSRKGTSFIGQGPPLFVPALWLSKEGHWAFEVLWDRAHLPRVAGPDSDRFVIELGPGSPEPTPNPPSPAGV